VTGGSGVKTVYSHPNVEDAKQKIANFLGIPPCLVLEADDSDDDDDVLVPPAAATVPRQPLYDELKQWRLNQARNENLPAYCIFDDQTLNAIWNQNPRDEAELINVRGIGPEKLKKYGAAILYIVRQYG
jgi:superfamily II DNA helicase RecQ